MFQLMFGGCKVCEKVVRVLYSQHMMWRRYGRRMRLTHHWQSQVKCMMTGKSRTVTSRCKLFLCCVLPMMPVARMMVMSVTRMLNRMLGVPQRQA